MVGWEVGEERRVMGKGDGGGVEWRVEGGGVDGVVRKGVGEMGDGRWGNGGWEMQSRLVVAGVRGAGRARYSDRVCAVIEVVFAEPKLLGF